MTCVSCLIGLRYVESFLLYLFISTLLLVVAFSMRRTLFIPAPQGGVTYREPLKRVRPGCVRTPSVWD